jgi:hypothetical protein
MTNRLGSRSIQITSPESGTQSFATTPHSPLAYPN